jgi:hypothetical protein
VSVSRHPFLEIYITLIFLFLFIGFFIHPVQAADVDIVCNEAQCTPNITSALFAPGEVWYPGKVLSRTIQVSNTSGVARRVSARAVNTIDSANFADKLTLVIRDSLSNVLWLGVLSDFYNLSSVNLTEIADETHENYSFEVNMDKQAGNEFQAGSTSFNLVLTYSDATVSNGTPTSTPVPTQVSGSSSGGSDNSGGTTDSNSDTASNTAGNTTTGASIITGPSLFTPFTGVFPTVASEGESLGGATQGAESSSGEVAGSVFPNGVYKTCFYPKLFLLFLLLEVVILSVLSKMISSDRYIRIAFSQALVTGVFIFLSSYFYCTWWAALCCALVGVASLSASYYRLHRQNENVYLRIS